MYKTSDATTIQVTRSSMPTLEEYIEEIRELWDSRWLTNMGKKHDEFKLQLLEYLNAPYVSLFTNGHMALEVAIEAFNLTGEVITTPFTFSSTTHAIVRKGLKPVFCDINFHDFTIDTDQLERLITDRTTAIMPVHVYGNVCNVREIERIAKKYNLTVIYDAAHAFGVTVGEDGIGSFGDACMFSFHATKVFNTIEGGALTLKDAELERKLNVIKNFGITGTETVEYPGTNSKMNEFQAAMGICNLRHIDSEIRRRQRIAQRYTERLSSVRGLQLCSPQPGIQSNFAYFPVVFDGFSSSRDEVYEKLKGFNIHARKYFYPITSDLMCYRGTFSSEETPVARYISERVLTLPLYGDLDLEIVDKICNIILSEGI